MTINKKIALLFVSSFIILLLFIYFILNEREETAIRFEDQLIENKIKNLFNIINNKKTKLNTIVYEYSKNDTIESLYKNTKMEENHNFTSKLNINYFLLLNENRDIIYSEVYDIDSEEFIDISTQSKVFFKRNDLQEYIDDKNTVKFLTLDYQRLLFTIEKIDGLGYIFVAKSIDSILLSDLSTSLDTYVSILPTYEFKEKIKESIFYYDISRDDKNWIYVNIEIKDEIEFESFFLSLKINRSFFNEITSSNLILLKLFFITYLIFNIILYIFISKIFTRRIRLLSNTVKNISKEKELVQDIELIYDDEITYLSSKMNEMFKVIREAQSENIRKERDFLQSVLDSQQQIIFITDGNNIENTNKRFLDIFESNNGFMHNIALLDNKTQSNLLNIAKEYSSIDKPARLKLNNEDKYFVFDISEVEISKYIVCMNDVSKYNEKIAYLKNKASKDGLTNCFNKTAIIEYCNYWLEIRSFGMIVLDIDKFKFINDTYGHFIGDCILKDLAILISSHLHKEDIIGRFGGEEFILLVSANSNNLINISNRIRSLVEENTFVYNDLEINITASLGCTNCNKGETFDLSFNRADEALYIAKNSGRNKVIYK